MKLAPNSFVAKWDLRFADNDTFQIEEGDLREFTADIADSFGVAAVNVPLYQAGDPYTTGYLVRYTVPSVGRESFYYALLDGQLPAPVAGTDPNWRLVPGPVPATQLHQFITLDEAQGIEGAGVVPGRSYGVTGNWNGASDKETVYLDGLENYFRRRGTLLRDDGSEQEVEVNLQAATYQAAGAGAGTVKSVDGHTADSAGNVALPTRDPYGASVPKEAQVKGFFTSASQQSAPDQPLAGDTSTGYGSVVWDRPAGRRFELGPDKSMPLLDNQGHPVLDANGQQIATPTWYCLAL